VKSKIGEAFKLQWRRPRTRITSEQYYDARKKANEAENDLDEQRAYDLAQTYFLYGYVAGYDDSNKMWQKKGGKK